MKQTFLDKVFGLGDLNFFSEISSKYGCLDDMYVYARVQQRSSADEAIQVPPMGKLDCLTIALCRQGIYQVSINDKKYGVNANTLIVVPPEALLHIVPTNAGRKDVIFLFISRTFLVDINIDLNALNIRSLISSRTPVIHLSDDETTKLMQYTDLLLSNAGEKDVTIFTRNIARSICAAVFYQLLQFNYTRIANRADDAQTDKSRRSTYVYDFIRLVHLNYMKERSVTFYASQLCISPKYLSMLVKEVTKRSAVDWINEFVIIEAKNLLRFSGKNVQQVAYALHFPNQSSFGKYFRHLTGMSPTDYQKS